MTQTDPHPVLTGLDRPLRLTLAGLWAERLCRAFWPLWTLLVAVLAVLAFGLQDSAPLEAVWIGGAGALVGLVVALMHGLRRFRRPTRAEALVRLDEALPGQPIAALTDRQAIGSSDPASVAVWQAHRARMAARAAAARPVGPDLRLADRDRYGLRYMALTGLVMALIFGSLWRVASVTGLGPGAAQAVAAGPAWEGWAAPPAYTGKPTLYLNDVTAETIALPQGTRVQVRLYGQVGDLTLAETVSGRLNPPPASDPAQDFDVVQSGRITIDGAGGRSWVVTALPDAAPRVVATGEVTREREGRMSLPFRAEDDFGVTGGTATIALDLAAADRRYGLAVEPEPREPLVLDLPMPMTGDRAAFDETLIEDVSEHPFANLPVTITLAAADARGQAGTAAPVSAVLPGRRFFDPLAAAVIEMRRDLLWSRANAPRVVQIMKAVTYRPEGLIRNERAYLRLRVALRRLEAEQASLSPEVRDEIAAAFWEIALMIEEGDLQSARERLQRAQDRLDEAIRNGADRAEIDELMAELREAMDDYMRQLAEEQGRNPDERMSENQEQMRITGDQLQQMLDELQRLLEEGRTAEAAELMEALRDLMENMRIAEGEGGQGQGGPGQQAMRNLQETLRDQQGLSDEAFNELQNPGQGQQGQGQQPGQGQPGQGRPGQGQGDGLTPGQRPGQGRGLGPDEGQGQGGGSLAERQQALRDRLEGLNRDALPGQGSERGEDGRRALDEAGRAMREAERALRDGDLSGALDRQAEAMEAMRDGMRALGEAMAEEQRQQQGGASGGGEAYGSADPNSQRDPLGRELGDAGRYGSDRNMLQGQDVQRRAQDLLDEIRRRSGEQTRPAMERDYLRRLLELF